ncbi:hypothetical protein M378DRAFT_1025705 [Amanita muscaria Koide BX008]|uniref:Uncharacterized protein n=1 Tax=Amanita muscaria (strain Koide BX008) TaxID=946122 RepID=A0A0C2SUJ5_AMAMK|nr:hypothetical protein M378DRAFT_1025705 [Amanita muscaria Koide BX008]
MAAKSDDLVWEFGSQFGPMAEGSYPNGLVRSSSLQTLLRLSLDHMEQWFNQKHYISTHNTTPNQYLKGFVSPYTYFPEKKSPISLTRANNP